jgi:uncharacterized protein YegL
MNTFNIREDDLVNNPSARLPICLCLDVSPSMSGNPLWGAPAGTDGVPIDELNEGVACFFEALRHDPVAHRSADLAIVTYSSEQFTIRDFGTIGDSPAPTLALQGNGTNIRGAVDHCLTLLENRKGEYREAGVEYYQPWLVLMTDGHPNLHDPVTAGQRACALVNDRKLTVFPIGIGNGADLEALAEFSPRTPPLTLKDLNFSAFFEWLSSSVSCVGRSQVGEAVTLDLEGMKGWTEI